MVAVDGDKVPELRRLREIRAADYASASCTRRLAGLVWLALCAIWGSTWLGIKLGLRDLPPITFAGIRFALAGAFVRHHLADRGCRPSPVPARLDPPGLYRLAKRSPSTTRWSSGASSTSPPGLAALLSATVPLFGLAAGAPYLQSEPLTLAKVLGVVLGLLGVGIIFSGELGIGGPIALWASVGIIVAALVTAHAGVLIKAQEPTSSPP